MQTRRIIAAAILFVCACVTAEPAGAADTSVYESLSDVVIGRVFLSRSQRAQLDAGRGSVPIVRPAPTRPVINAPRKKVTRPPAGYIISSSGQTRVWSQSGFIARDPGSSMRFPGDVEVTRTDPENVRQQDSESADDGE